MTFNSGDTEAGKTGGASNTGRIRFVFILALFLIAALALVRLVAPDYMNIVIVMLLSALAVAGVFFLFAIAAGVVRLSSAGPETVFPDDLLDAVNEGYVIVENERVTYANKTYRSFFPNGEVQTVERLFSGAPEIADIVYRLAQAARERRESVEEMRVARSLTHKHDFAWYRLRVRPLGKGSCTLWTVTDVTSERQRQENVFQELQHAIDYLDHAPAGFLSVNPKGAIVYMNATLAEWLDYDLAKVGSGGLEVSDILADPSNVMVWTAAGEAGEVFTQTFDLDLLGRNGQHLPVRIYHRLAYGQDGSASESRTLVLKRSEVAETSDVAPTSDMPFARFFNNTPIAIATLARNGEIFRANSAFARLFGVRVATGNGENRQKLTDWISEGQREELAAAVLEASSGRAVSQPLELSIGQDGSRSARVWISSAGDDGSHGESTILYALDTTEFRQVEEQLAQAQKMNAIGQLAGGVAHDFNNVLQAIIGYCDLLLGNHRPTDPSFQDIMQIKQNANRAASLVRQLLAFSRRQTLRPEVLNLSDRLSDLTTFLKRLLGERVELDFRHGRDLWPVLADVHQLEQVMMNLAVNARDAMPDGGHLSIRTENIPSDVAAKLNVPGMTAGDYVLIETGDTGTGMPAEVVEKIFEPFFTTKDIGKGTGLGLSTVFGIVKQSNGFIDVRSTVGEGTRFLIYLPRHIPKETDVEVEEKPVSSNAPAMDMTGQGVILLVEDEDPVRAVNARALTARGYTVLEAASGVEALEIVSQRETPVDLVISDVVMPEMDGPTLLGELRQRYANLKVIFVSGYAEEAFRKHLPEGEDFNFLPKPFGLKQLVETVKQVMRG
ncbi:response regulator [Microvirga sp. W0021]|uniref:histidine kinase n=1 Tax=Hohaiivirga grylli TaxID=3133970 RepID=A0ABV0BMG0_9HYPH